MKKEDIADVVMRQARINKKDAKTAVDTVFEVIAEAMVLGQEVKVSGFGTFKVKRSEAYQRASLTNPSEIITVAEKNRPTFKASQTLVKRLNDEE